MRKERMCVIAHSKCHLQLRLQISQPVPCRSPAEHRRFPGTVLPQGVTTLKKSLIKSARMISTLIPAPHPPEKAPAPGIPGFCFSFICLPASVSSYLHGQQKKNSLQDVMANNRTAVRLFTFYLMCGFSGELGDFIRSRAVTVLSRLICWMHAHLLFWGFFFGSSGLPSESR